MASAYSLRMSLQNTEASTLKKKKRGEGGKKMVSSSEWLITSSDIGSFKTNNKKNEKKHTLECTRPPGPREKDKNNIFSLGF